MDNQMKKVLKYTKKLRKQCRKLILSVFVLVCIISATVVAGVCTYINTKDAKASEKVDRKEKDKDITVRDTTSDDFISIMEEDYQAEKEKAEAEEQARIAQEEKEKAEAQAKVDSGKAYVIRCTGYCDTGYMRGGKWTYDGAIAGKYEWLGRTCNLYRVNEDGSMGELIGSYTFEDTGNGINGSLKKGTSVDVWHPSEDAVWDWIAEYGDYVYIEFTS